MATLAYNILKMVRKLGHGVGSPGPAAPAAATVSDARHALAGAARIRLRFAAN